MTPYISWLSLACSPSGAGFAYGENAPPNSSGADAGICPAT